MYGQFSYKFYESLRWKPVKGFTPARNRKALGGPHGVFGPAATGTTDAWKSKTKEEMIEDWPKVFSSFSLYSYASSDALNIENILRNVEFSRIEILLHGIENHEFFEFSNNFNRMIRRAWIKASN